MKSCTVVRTLRKKGVHFVITFDEYGVVDTISRDGKLISAAHRDAITILNNADKIYSGAIPHGFEYAR